MGWRIKTVSRMTGIPKGTILAWERRYGLLNPERTASGYRVYRPEDVAVLERIQSLREEGFQIGEAVEMIRATAPTPLRQVSTLERARIDVLDRLLDMDAAGADRAARPLAALAHEDVLLQVYLPVLREVGDRWERGEATVVQEHHASAWCRERITSMLRQVTLDRPGAPEAVLATPPEERHELGLLAVAVRLGLRGFNVVYLGPDLPTADLCAFLAESTPRLVCVSVVVERSLDWIRGYARALADSAPEATILLGGPATVPLVDERSERIRYGATLDDVDEVRLAP